MKKYLISGLSVLVIFTSAMPVVFAETASVSGGASVTTSSPTVEQKMILEVNGNGKALLRGTVAAVSSTTLTVKGWGGNWNIVVGSDTQVLPNIAGSISLANFSVGDFVGVQGVVDQNNSWTINAKLVRDWTYRKEVRTEQQTNKKEVKNTEQTGRAEGVGRIFEGTASGVSASSFTLNAKSNITYTVNLATGAKLINRLWLSLSGLGDIHDGDSIRIFATASGTSTAAVITAIVVRDISLPVVTR